MTKLKKTAPPPKTYEEKTAEEKETTSIIKTKDGKEVKGILKKAGAPRKSGNLKFGQCIVYEYEKND